MHPELAYEARLQILPPPPFFNFIFYDYDREFHADSEKYNSIRPEN